MKVTYPLMGNAALGIRTLLYGLGLDVVDPPPFNRLTVEIGKRYAPEFSCMPLLLHLGSFVQAYEKGADTIVMVGGCGPCRLGYYCGLEQVILKDCGFNYQMIVVEPPRDTPVQCLRDILRLANGKRPDEIARVLRLCWAKVRLADELEKTAQKLRPREMVCGAVNSWYQTALTAIDKAADYQQLLQVKQEAAEHCAALAIDQEREVLKVGLIGEIYTMLEPFACLELEQKLGQLGAEVVRSLYLSEWLNEHVLHGHARNLAGSRDAVVDAPPYLQNKIGGHCAETVGSAVRFCRQEVDGLIQLFPLTCMPEIVAQQILPQISRDYDTPLLSLIVDEHSAEAGIVTRLEAFLDLLAARKTAAAAASQITTELQRELADS